MKRNLFGLFLLFFSLSAILRAADPVTEALQPYVDSGTMPGMVTVMATADDLIAVDTIGWSNIEAKTPMAADTMFWVASQTKALVGCCVMILVDEKKIDLDAPITDYLPELADIQVYRHAAEEKLFEDTGVGRIVEAKAPHQMMTLRQCLSHTAGWRFVSPCQKRFGIDWLDHQRAVLTYAVMGLDWEPGAEFHYSNIGINVAAAAVERVCGKPIEVMMQERIFEPLGMTDTTFWPNEDQLSRMATPYQFDKEKNGLVPLDRIPFLGFPLSDRTKRFAEGGGGLFSSAKDFVKFYQMLAGQGSYQGKTILSKESCAVMTTKQTGDNVDTNYGFGIVFDEKGFGHGGAAGTNGYVFKNGLVVLYLVMVQNIPDQNNIYLAFLAAAQKEYQEKNAAQQ